MVVALDAVRVLRLPMKAQYFDAIKAGTKPWEYRLRTPYWCKRIESREYDEILLTRGYPPSYMVNRMLRRPWRGYEVQRITHPHFGESEVTVFAIKVN